MLCQNLVHILVKYARLHPDLKVLGVHLQDAIHAVEIDHDPTPNRDGIALQAAARAPARQRDAVLISIGRQTADLIGALGPYDDIRQMGCVCRLIATMMLPVRIPIGNMFCTQHRFQRVENSVLISHCSHIDWLLFGFLYSLSFITQAIRAADETDFTRNSLIISHVSGNGSTERSLRKGRRYATF